MKTVALPIETKVRELHGKLWLGVHLLERGHDIVIGPSWEVVVTLSETKPDVYISQGPSDSKIARFDKFRQAGIRVYGITPESGVGAPTELFMSNKQSVVEHIDGFLCWGEKQKNALSKNYENDDNIHLTGNPRFDLLSPRFRAIYQKQAKNLNKEYGPFVLINTNFGLGNPFHQEYIQERLNKSKGLQSISKEKFVHNQRTFYSFLESILHVSGGLNQHDIIVRPHPSEDHEMYSRSFAQYDDIHVIHSGDVRGWIAAAEVVMHYDCTTGIESVLIGTPALSYRPLDKESEKKEIPQAVSNEVFERDSLVSEILKLASDSPKEMSAEQNEILRPYFANTDSCAAEAVCDVIEQQEPLARKDYQQLSPSTRELLETRIRATKWYDLATKAYDIVQEIKGEGSSKQMREMRKQKFPGLNYDEIVNNIRDMSEDSAPISSIKSVPNTKDTYTIHASQ